MTAIAISATESAQPGIVLDGERWLRSLRLPLASMAQLRAMRSGERYTLFDFVGPREFATDGSALATITRVRGGFRFAAYWNVVTGDGWGKQPPIRLHAHGAFKLLPQRQILLLPSTERYGQNAIQCRQSFEQFARILRLSEGLGQAARDAGAVADALVLTPQLCWSNEHLRVGRRPSFLFTRFRYPRETLLPPAMAPKEVLWAA